MVDEVDHPGEAVVDVGVDLEPAGRFQGRESVQHAAQHPQGVDLLAGVELVAAQHGRPGGEHPVDGRDERVVGPGRAGGVARRVPAGVLLHVRPHRLRAGGEGVAAGPALGGVADGVGELGHGQDGDAVGEVGLAGDVLVERGGLDSEPFGEQAHAELVEPDLVGQRGAGLGDRRRGEPGPRHGSASWPGTAGPARGPRSGVWACG